MRMWTCASSACTSLCRYMLRKLGLRSHGCSCKLQPLEDVREILADSRLYVLCVLCSTSLLSLRGEAAKQAQKAEEECLALEAGQSACALSTLEV
jgi:hypothetical protein